MGGSDLPEVTPHQAFLCSRGTDDPDSAQIS